MRRPERRRARRARRHGVAPLYLKTRRYIRYVRWQTSRSLGGQVQLAVSLLSVLAFQPSPAHVRESAPHPSMRQGGGTQTEVDAPPELGRLLTTYERQTVYGTEQITEYENATRVEGAIPENQLVLGGNASAGSCTYSITQYVPYRNTSLPGAPINTTATFHTSAGCPDTQAVHILEGRRWVAWDNYYHRVHAHPSPRTVTYSAHVACEHTRDYRTAGIFGFSASGTPPSAIRHIVCP